MNSNLLPRMIALAVVIVVGVYYIGFDVMQYRITSQPFPVTVLMPSAGGLYSGADVTYRGVQVGTVTALDLDPRERGRQAGHRRGRSASPTTGPSGSRSCRPSASSTSTSQPTSGDGPDLTAGSVIPADRVILPTPIGTCAGGPQHHAPEHQPPGSAYRRELSWPAPSSAPDPDLRSIIVTGQRLFDALVAAQPETVNLVDRRPERPEDAAGDRRRPCHLQPGPGLADRAAAQLQQRHPGTDPEQPGRRGAAQPVPGADSAAIAALVSNLAPTPQVTDENQPGPPGRLRAAPCRLRRPGVGGRRRPGPRPTRVQHRRSGVRLHPREPDAGTDAGGGHTGADQHVHLHGSGHARARSRQHSDRPGRVSAAEFRLASG